MSPLPVKKDDRPIEVGDRFTSRDWRDAGRTVEVRAVLAAGTRYKVQNETHPLNPSAVGRHTIISEQQLRTRWARVSR
ncbi:hypothetical protein [Microbacterium kunmingense]|uniref:hypothetical protein n=1 Tax=Microbacterium kunmingense TaxID=2915939 RepID=UPI003D7624CD